MDKLIIDFKKYINDRGVSTLEIKSTEDNRRVNAILGDFFPNDAKKHKNAIFSCLEKGFVKKIQNVSQEDRAICKKQLAESLHEDEGYDIKLCYECLNILGAVLFDEKFEEIPKDSEKKKPSAHNAIVEEEEPESEIDTLIGFAERGITPAQNKLGYCYQHGEGVQKDLNKAVYWYTKAAEQSNEIDNLIEFAKMGNTPAQNKLGYCYQHGVGVQKDVDRAVYWLTKAADQGYTEAQKYLRVLFNELIRLAEQGNADAQYNLGKCYQNGNGVPKNIQTAIYWYGKAMAQGHADAESAMNDNSFIKAIWKNAFGINLDS